MLDEKFIKLLLMVILLLVILIYWLIPKTPLAKKLVMNESLFITTNIIGIMCGLAGLATTFIQPEKIIELHLWELIAAPFALIYVYWLMAEKVSGGQDGIDEKQAFNITSAAAFAWVLSIPAMALVFMMFQSSVLQGLIWFPIFFFQGLLCFSAATLFMFKKA